MSDLALNVATTFVDDEGVDLVFTRRERSTTLAVQVKSRSTDAVEIVKYNRFSARVGANTFRPRRDLYMLYVLVDRQQGTFERGWLVPSTRLAKATTDTKGRYKFVASLNPDSKDQWSRYRFRRDELAGRILDVLDSLT